MAVTVFSQTVINIWVGFLSRPLLSDNKTRHNPKRDTAGSRWWLHTASKEVRLLTYLLTFEIPNRSFVTMSYLPSYRSMQHSKTIHTYSQHPAIVQCLTQSWGEFFLR